MQIVSQQFNDFAKGDVRPHSFGCRISFDKAWDDDISLFTLNQSMLNSGDLLGSGEDNVLQAWDFYNYKDYTDRITYMEWERSLEFPYSVVTARADFGLANTDGYFTRGSGSPIASNILPKRPVRLLSGFKNTLIPQFVGLTQGMPESSETEKIAEFTALDFLTQIYDMPIRKTIAMANVRTDEVLANIFQQFGLSSAQYSLEKGRNVIPFLFFEKDQTLAGDVIRPLMEAEMGMLWLSEDGIIKFKSRLQISTDPVYELNGSEIVDLSVASDDEIINTVNFTGEVRVLAEWQSVFSKAETESAHVVRANNTFIFEAGLKDPCLEIQQPVIGKLAGVSWFVARNTAGVIVGNVSVQSVELRTNSYDITFKNDNAFDVNISEMELFGQPGKVAYPVEYPMSYPPSVEKFEAKEININNNFIQTEDQMKSLGLMILNDYAEYASIINCEIKGNPALQLGDIISIDYKQYTGNYRITAMTNSLRDSKFTQTVRLRQVDDVSWFVLNSSMLNGTDILAP